MRSDAPHLILGVFLVTIGLATNFSEIRGIWGRTRMHQQGTHPVPGSAWTSDTLYHLGIGSMLVATGMVGGLFAPNYWGWALWLTVPFWLIGCIWIAAYIKHIF